MKHFGIDLSVVATGPADLWPRQLLGELVALLLRPTERPVLIAKPTIRE